jgi:hypothetical protein
MSSKTIISNTMFVDDDGSISLRELGQNDILLGRGSGPNAYIGNVRFRSLVRDSIQTPGFSPTPDGKSEFAKVIVNTVKARNGRFVKRVISTRKNCGDIFVEVPDRVSLDKTKQTVRHQLRADAQGDKEIKKYRAKFPRSLLERKSKERRAAVSKPSAPNANAASIEEEHPIQSSVCNRNLNGPTLSGIVDPVGSLFVGELHRQGEVVRATRTAATSLMGSRRLFDSTVVLESAAQMLASGRECISNTLLLSELMGGAPQEWPTTSTAASIYCPPASSIASIYAYSNCFPNAGYCIIGLYSSGAPLDNLHHIR